MFSILFRNVSMQVEYLYHMPMIFKAIFEHILKFDLWPEVTFYVTSGCTWKCFDVVQDVLEVPPCQFSRQSEHFENLTFDRIWQFMWPLGCTQRSTFLCCSVFFPRVLCCAKFQANQSILKICTFDLWFNIICDFRMYLKMFLCCSECPKVPRKWPIFNAIGAFLKFNLWPIKLNFWGQRSPGSVQYIFSNLIHASRIILSKSRCYLLMSFWNFL